MKCPFCGYTESKVIDSRPTDENERIRRRRECIQCSKRFTTYETIEDHFLKLDPYLRRLIFAGGMEIRLDMVLDMEGDIFREYFPE